MSHKWALALQPEGPVPLYQQIAVALRYRIATGELVPGEHLPPLRDAAQWWGVNYHTVRRAYGQLEAEELVRRHRRRGTIIAGGQSVAPGAVRANDRLGRFVSKFLKEARNGYGLSPAEFASLIVGSTKRPGGRACVTVVECNPHQCHDLASQIETLWRVEVFERVLGEGVGSLPPGPIIGTFFHYAEIRQRWPDRLPDMRFPAIYPDPVLREEVEKKARRSGDVTIPLVERERSLADSMARDAALILGAGYRLHPLIDPPLALLRTALRTGPVLFAPRMWDKLHDEVKTDPNAIEIHYVFRETDLAAVAVEFAWTPALEKQAS